jgi:hypothetical protein
MADTTGQQSSTVAHDITRNPASIWLSPMCDETADHGEGRTWAAPAPAETCEDCSEPWVEYVRSDLASVSSASAEPRKDTVAFVQDWLMNADYDPTQFDKGFAAAIDARHGFDDAALTVIAERFCAAPLPDTVCADLVAIKPMAGRSGTNLMTVAEAKAVLRSIFPEPVPATNQAGEVKEAIARIVDPEAWRNHDSYRAIMTTESCTQETIDSIAHEKVKYSLNRAAKILDLMLSTPASHEAVFEVHVGGENTTVHTRAGSNADPAGSLTAAIEALNAERTDAAKCPFHTALATQPATSQEGEAVAVNARAIAEASADMPDAFTSPVDRAAAIELAVTTAIALAATPTPPTLSEDLREAIVRDLSEERRRYKEESPTWRAFGFCIDIAEKAALAQVKAS